MNAIINNAINYTTEVAAPYWESVLDQRLESSEKRAGSFFVGVASSQVLEDKIRQANWEIHEGSLEEGKIILKTNDFIGRDGVKPLNQVSAEDIFFVNPKAIEGREEYATYVNGDDELPDTNETWLIISTYNPQTQSVDVEKPFIPTIFPGRLIGPNDTVKGMGDFVKLIPKKG